MTSTNEPFGPVYQGPKGPLEPGETEAIDSVAHLNALVLAGGSVSLDLVEADDDDRPPTLDELEAEFGGPPTEEEMRVLEEDYQRYLDRSRSASMISLEDSE